jgi:NitT/TauT family transport system substrate-binding protein
MKKNTVSVILIVLVILSVLTGCTDSSKTTSIKQVDYDPAVEVKRFKLNELSEKEKNYTVQMGYNNCDHMVAALVGEYAGIYKALGLKVNITKTSKIMEAMASGEMDVGYQGIKGAINSVNNGAPLFMAAANHVGGSRYLVASNDIKTGKDLIGKNLAIGTSAAVSPEWMRYADELGIPRGLENYNVIDMAQADAAFALKAGKIDGFICCDPYASQAEFEGFGHIMATGWGAHVSDDKSAGWGMCCVYCMSRDFKDEYPELARRLIIAHSLATEYLYLHPYNAAMMFAEGFGTSPDVGLRTVYMKTVAEGRTLTWEFTKDNLRTYIDYYHEYDIPEKDIPNINDINKFMSTEVIGKAELSDFSIFIKEKVDPYFPIGTTYLEWLRKAREIDGIPEDDKTGERTLAWLED